MYLSLVVLCHISAGCLQILSFCDDMSQLESKPQAHFPTRTLSLTLLMALVLYFLGPIDEHAVNPLVMVFLMSVMLASMISGFLAICLGIHAAFIRLVSGPGRG